MKEIIIDGVNVAECGFKCWKHNENELIEHYCGIFNNKCICNPTCYFKRLQHLKQENGELKKRCEEWALETVKKQGAIDGKDFRIDKYEQALREIREELKPFDDYDVVQDVITLIKEVLNENS